MQQHYDKQGYNVQPSHINNLIAVVRPDIQNTLKMFKTLASQQTHYNVPYVINDEIKIIYNPSNTD